MSFSLYPKISVNKQFWLSVSDHYQLYVECSGNEKGIPVLYLHGGPGAGSSANARRYFDPEKYYIIQFDQRGCGRSKPAPSIENNTTAKLVEDIEAIREHLAISKWLVCGGSWGTTLALAYGIQHAEAIHGFILRGIFLARESEYDWLYGDKGAARIFPKYYRDFLQLLPPQSAQKPLLGYQQLLSSYNELQRVAASRAWYQWEARLSSMEHSEDVLSRIDDLHQALCMATVSNHYFINQCFLSQPLLEQIHLISHLPAIILHGRYDMVCPLESADLLVEHWPNATLQILPQAGHSGFEQQVMAAFCKATISMANFINERDL